jgi:DNA-binding MarR family transcriptional regulator
LLEELGLLHVEKKDPPKTSVVSLTTRAERQLPALESAVESVAEQATNGFTNDELEALVSLLERMEKNLG